MMKRILTGMLGIGALINLISCQQVQDEILKMQYPAADKIEDARGVLDKVLAYIADHDPELSFNGGQLLDAELGIPRFEVVPMSEIKHFDDEDIVDGFIVKPVVEDEDANLLIVVEAVDMEAANNLNEAMLKVKSDQVKRFADAGMLTMHLINDNKTVRQGNFLLYATWEDAVQIEKVFERHVR